MCSTFVCCAHSGHAEINTLPVRTLYALNTHFIRTLTGTHFEISKCHFGTQKWHFDVFKRSLVISCRIRAWLGLVHTFQATNGFLLRTHFGNQKHRLGLYALCTHFIRTLYSLSKALWKAQSGTLGFQSATFKFQSALWGSKALLRHLMALHVSESGHDHLCSASTTLSLSQQQKIGRPIVSKCTLMRHFEIKSALLVFKSALWNFKKMTSSKIRYFTGACTFCEHICIVRHGGQPFWYNLGAGVVRPMSRLGTLAFKVPLLNFKVPALGTVSVGFAISFLSGVNKHPPSPGLLSLQVRSLRSMPKCVQGAAQCDKKGGVLG